MTATRPPSPWNALASRALGSALAGRWEEAADATRQISDVHGGTCLPQVMLAWIDVLGAVTGITEYGPGVHLSFLDTEAGAIRTADTVPPEVAWAGRLVAARFADDEDTFRALLRAVPPGERRSARRTDARRRFSP